MTTTFNPDFFTERPRTRKFILVDDENTSYSPPLFLTLKEQRIIENYILEQESMKLLPYSEPLMSKEWFMDLWTEAVDMDTQTEE